MSKFDGTEGAGGGCPMPQSVRIQTCTFGGCPIRWRRRGVRQDPANRAHVSHTRRISRRHVSRRQTHSGPGALDQRPPAVRVASPPPSSDFVREGQEAGARHQAYDRSASCTCRVSAHERPPTAPRTMKACNLGPEGLETSIPGLRREIPRPGKLRSEIYESGKDCAGCGRRLRQLAEHPCRCRVRHERTGILLWARGTLPPTSRPTAPQAH